VIYFNGD